MGLESVKHSFDLPALMIESCQLVGRGLGGIEDGGCQSINRFGILDSLKAIIDYPQELSIGFVPSLAPRDPGSSDRFSQAMRMFVFIFQSRSAPVPRASCLSSFWITDSER